jgi:hypothetical protein
MSVPDDSSVSKFLEVKKKIQKKIYQTDEESNSVFIDSAEVSNSEDLDLLVLQHKKHQQALA